MVRPLRIEYPGVVYHVMNRGGVWYEIVLNDEDGELFCRKGVRNVYCIVK